MLLVLSCCSSIGYAGMYQWKPIIYIGLKPFYSHLWPLLPQLDLISACGPVEQIWWVFGDNWRIIFVSFHKNIYCGFSLELPCPGNSNEYPKRMFLWRNKQNYPLIITKYPPYLSLTVTDCEVLNWPTTSCINLKSPRCALHTIVISHFLLLYNKALVFIRLKKLAKGQICQMTEWQIIWATSSGNLFYDLCEHQRHRSVCPGSLISAFVIRCLDSIISLLAKSKISKH